MQEKMYMSSQSPGAGVGSVASAHASQAKRELQRNFGSNFTKRIHWLEKTGLIDEYP